MNLFRCPQRTFCSVLYATGSDSGGKVIKLSSFSSHDLEANVTGMVSKKMYFASVTHKFIDMVPLSSFHLPSSPLTLFLCAPTQQGHSSAVQHLDEVAGAACVDILYF